MKELKIQVPEGKEAKWIDGVLKLVDEKKEPTYSPRYRIKTFEDAVNELGPTHYLVEDYNKVKDMAFSSNDIIAFMKLRIITTALNEGWEPTYDYDEIRYWPGFSFYRTEKDYQKIKEQQEEYNYNNINSHVKIYGGVFTENTGQHRAIKFSGVEHKFYFKNGKTALYAAQQFADIFAQYFLGNNLTIIKKFGS